MFVLLPNLFHKEKKTNKNDLSVSPMHKKVENCRFFKIFKNDFCSKSQQLQTCRNFQKKNTNYNSIKPFIFCIQFVDGIAIFCLLSLLKLAFVFVLCSFFPNFISNTRKPEFSVHFKKESSYFTNGL